MNQVCRYIYCLVYCKCVYLLGWIVEEFFSFCFYLFTIVMISFDNAIAFLSFKDLFLNNFLIEIK